MVGSGIRWASGAEPEIAGQSVLSGVTGHSDDESDLSPEAQRKREQREREKAAGVEVFELKMGPSERAMLAEGRALRGSKGIPYTATEYLLTLLRNDNRLLEKQRGKLEGRRCKTARSLCHGAVAALGRGSRGVFWRALRLPWSCEAQPKIQGLTARRFYTISVNLL